MTLEEVRKVIDRVDTQIKPLFLERMACADHVAAAKAENGSDVFVPDREDEIILKRTGDVDVSVKREYEMFLRHLMSVCRRYQYGILTKMQEQVIADALKQAGLDKHVSHEQITVSFTDHREKSSLNLYLNMIRLNEIPIDHMELKSQGNEQQVTIQLHGNLNQSDMRRLVCQLGKEAENFQILSLQ